MTPGPFHPPDAVWVIHTKVLHLADGPIPSSEVQTVLQDDESDLGILSNKGLSRSAGYETQESRSVAFLMDERRKQAVRLATGQKNKWRKSLHQQPFETQLS